MTRGMVFGFLVVAATLAAGLALAQHHDPKAHGAMPSGQGDARQLVTLPAPMAEHMLANMRDHLLALHQIQDALSRGDTDLAAKIAEERLGMISLKSHGAAHMAPFMPEAMREVGTSLHHAASRFAIAAKDAGITGDLRPALGALAAVSGACVGCHAGYRIR